MSAKGFAIRHPQCSRSPATFVFVAVAPTVHRDHERGEARVHRFRAGHACRVILRAGQTVDRQERAFSSPEAWWNLLEEWRNKKQATWVLGYNMGYTMTLLDLWTHLIEARDPVVSCVLEDPPFIVRVRHRGRMIVYTDALNYLNMPLWQLSESTSCPLPRPSYRTLPTTPGPDDLPYHVRVLEEAILGLVSQTVGEGACSWKPTAAGLAWDCYFKEFNDQKIYVHFHPEARKLERQCYYGGRVQVFRRGFVAEPVSVYDFNSLYPSAMSTVPMPSRFLNYKESSNARDLAAVLPDLAACAHVRLAPGAGPFPHRLAGMVVCADRAGSAYLCGRELELALSRGAVRTVYSRALYRADRLFERFVQHWYARKQDGRTRSDKAATATAKIMLNSLYGKFGQSGKQWEHAPDSFSPGPYRFWWSKHPANKSVVRMRSVAGRVERQSGQTHTQVALVALSASVTAAGRVRLEEALSCCGKCDVLYTDTDSVHTIRAGPRRLEQAGLVDPSRLGALRLEGKYPNAYYWGRQHYRVGDDIVCSAIKPTAVEVAHGLYLQEAQAGVTTTLETGNLNQVVVSGRVVERNRRTRDVAG